MERKAYPVAHGAVVYLAPTQDQLAGLASHYGRNQAEETGLLRRLADELVRRGHQTRKADRAPMYGIGLANLAAAGSVTPTGWAIDGKPVYLVHHEYTAWVVELGPMRLLEIRPRWCDWRRPGVQRAGASKERP